MAQGVRFPSFWHFRWRLVPDHPERIEFVVERVELPDHLTAGGCLNGELPGAVTYLYYDGQLARARYESHSVSGGVWVAF